MVANIVLDSENEYIDYNIYAESDHILAPDRMTRVSGSVKVDRDLRRDLRALDKNGDRDLQHEMREENISLIPLDEKGRKKEWCSYPYHEGESELGKDDKGWRPRSDFSEYTDRHGKKRLREHCDKCRAKHERRMYALQREATGKPVRSWNRRQAC